jgi:multiple sugar transport system substrate-binding protein
MLVKNILKAAVTTAALLASAGYAAAQAQNVIWWDFLGGGDGVRMKALIADFNAEHPDIQIEGTTLDWGVPFYTKVRTSAGVGEGPDVMTYHLSRIPIALDEGVLSPITDEDLANAGVTKEDFFPRSIEAATSDGTLYAVPFDIHAVILYYNKDLLAGTPYLDAEGKLTGINNLADFTQALQALKDKGVEVPLSLATGDASGATVWRAFYTLLAQQGGELIVGTEVLPGDNEAKAVKAIQILTDWRNAELIPEQTEYPASVALFGSGQAAFHFNGVWEVPTFTDLHEKGSLGDWSATVIPTLLDQPATWADSHAFAIPTGKEMDPAKRKAVMEVIGWMEKNALRWADAGHIPAYLPVATSAEYKAMEPNAAYAPLADNAAYDPPSTIAGVASPVYDASLNIIVPAIHGFMTPEDAVVQIREQLQPLLN